MFNDFLELLTHELHEVLQERKVLHPVNQESHDLLLQLVQVAGDVGVGVPWLHLHPGHTFSMRFRSGLIPASEDGLTSAGMLVKIWGKYERDTFIYIYGIHLKGLLSPLP